MRERPETRRTRREFVVSPATRYYLGNSPDFPQTGPVAGRFTRFGLLEFPVLMLRFPRFSIAISVLFSLALPRFLGADEASAKIPPTDPRVVKHVAVFSEDGRFGGWPANHGAWSWGNEIVVGFGVGYYKDMGPARHAIDREKPEEHVLARSLDGGETWDIEHPAKQNILVGKAGMRHGTVPPGSQEKEPVECPGGIDFTHPDFAFTARMTDIHKGASRFYYSTDRAHTWQGPFKLPLFGQPGILARTDYIVNGPSDCMLFMAASKQNGREGRVICVRTTDGGKTWNFVSYIGPEPKGYAIMPSTVRIGPADLLTTIRMREGEPSWIDAWISHDNGQSWEFYNRPVESTGEGNPPAMIKLLDGRLCLTYAYRAEPFSMQAKLSSDSGKTWSEPIMLRPDGAGRDIGYPRTVQRPDGKIVTIYYFYDASDPDRTIQATIWDPGK